jgi:diguanylate cyclase (GGDEF)-like protein
MDTARASALLRSLPQALAVVDVHGRILLSNDRFRAMWRMDSGVQPEGRQLADLLLDGNLAGEEAVDAASGYLAGLRSAPRCPEPVELVLGSGQILALQGWQLAAGEWALSLEDVTSRRAVERRAEALAHQDALTGLANRRVFGDRLAAALAQSERTGRSIAVLCLDLDRFKSVNDTLGHAFGDTLLRTVAERIRSVVRQADTIARLGGDEFAILQAGVGQPGAATALAQRLVDLIGRSYVLDGHLVNTGVSVGVAVGPADAADPDQLLRNADLALYEAKAGGRGRFCFFEPAMDMRMQERRRLELDLRKALAMRELELHYQPQVSVETGRLTGFEALLRWQHPERGLVPPSEFVPLAEETGLIVRIGEWVLRAACREAARWPGELSLAVNLSPVQFKSQRLLDAVRDALAQSGLNPARLELEITEGVLLQESGTTLAILHALRRLGVRIAMDDFGTGYSSLSYLRSFPFDKLKIDKSFVRGLFSSADCAAIVRAVAALGASLGISTTAEGVETAEQMGRIREEGCTEAQGYLFSRPVPACEVERLIMASLPTGQWDQGAPAAAA